MLKTKMTQMVKMAALLCAAVILVVFAGGCSKIKAPDEPSSGNSSATANTDDGNLVSTPTEAPTAVPTAEPTEVPTAIPTQDPSTLPAEGPYIDVSKIKRVYVNPNSTVTVASSVISDPSGWTSSDSEVATLGVSNGVLTVTSTKTGYSKLVNSFTGEIVHAYSLLPMEKSDETRVKEGINYFLYYEKGSHTMTVFSADSEGYYTVPVKTISVACGSTPSKTPVGLHTLEAEADRERWHTFSAGCHAQYAITYFGNVFLHSTCFGATRENSVLGYYYESIGASSTGGCLRMQVGEMLWIWENCPGGTQLKIVNGNPLGSFSERPGSLPDSAMFDPTDPAYLDYLKKNGYVD